MLEPYIQRFINGDDSVLSHILMNVEGKRTSQLEGMEEHLYRHLVKKLVIEGRRGRRRRSSTTNRERNESSFENCVLVLRILLVASARGGEVAAAVRKSLLEAGIVGCKAMDLDRYFDGESWMVPYVMNFAVLVLKVYRAHAKDILKVQTNAENVERLKNNLDAPVGGVVSRTRNFQEGENTQGRVLGRGGGNETNNRRQRDLPKKPSFVPFSQNPLYSEKEEENKWMTPQFPTPITLFARQFGLGCEPKLPNLTTFALPTLLVDIDLLERQGQSSLGGTSLVSRRLIEALNFEKNRDPLFSSYLANGCLLIWGNTIAFQGGDFHSASSVTGWEVTSLHSHIISPMVLNVPVPVVSFSCGAQCCYLVNFDGKVLACGSDEWGQLGSNRLAEKKSVLVDGGNDMKLRFHNVLLRKGEEIVKVKAGSAFVAAVVKGSNRMYLWGQNSYGQCLVADRKIVSNPIMIEVPERYGEITDVACGSFFAAASFECGVIGTWGLATMLGVNVTDDKLIDAGAGGRTKCAKTIILFNPINERVVALRAGPWHCLAITSTGSVYSWGVDRHGRLGHGDTRNGERMSRIESLSNHHVIDASCGTFHSAVLTSNGVLLVFGENSCGQLGIFGVKCLSEAEILPLPKPAIGVSCGREHTCVLLEDGDVMICGTLRSSGIGLGYGARFSVPRRSLQSYLILSIESGPTHAIAAGLLRSLTIQVIPSSRDILSKDEIGRLNEIVLQNGVRTVSGGNSFKIVLTESGRAFAVGENQKGQLGIGDISNTSPSVSFRKVSVPENVHFASLDCGMDYTIGISTCGGVYSWGSNSHGQLGHGDSIPLHESVFIPQEVMALRAARVAQIACGGTFVVALTQDGDVYTWGEGLYCGRAKRDTPCLMKPMILEGLSHIVFIAAGFYHAIALSESHIIYAWGKGPLGNGGAPNVIIPTPVAITFAHCVRQLGCGPLNCYAITEIGDLFVWGVNESGQCGVPQQSATSHSIGYHTDMATPTDLFSHFPSMLLFPTFVASEVRDAAFGLSCGVIIKEDGSSAVTGELYNESGKVFYRTFTPQQLPSASSQQRKGAHQLMSIADKKNITKGPSKGFFSRCFGGVDMLFTVIEWNRPTPAEVISAIEDMAGYSGSAVSGGKKTKEEVEEGGKWNEELPSSNEGCE
ncbi:Regulator of chromosome condensation [Trypanosoma melophagium]|uniref:Regulator of chromosome condensation n=1 Tax=Trypanosoma melophagium TaxID=715481 RepID=UPI00351A1B00|nr:Regulator of chromosome condensation [Trypanosoma melophagium]